MIGRVVSNKMEKTAAVLVTSTKTHPLYKKTFIRTKKYLAQDDLSVKIGDLVEMIQSKPISKRKRWVITKVIGREFEAIAKEHLKEDVKEAIGEVLPVETEEMSEVESSEEKVKSSKVKVLPAGRQVKKIQVKRKEKLPSL